MSDLLKPKERDQILERIKKQRFASTRKNVPSWCMQWLALAIYLLWLLQFLVGNTDFDWKRDPNLALIWSLVIFLSALQCQRYKERFILKQMTEKMTQENGPTDQASAGTATR